MQTDNPWQTLGLPSVINAAGKMTYLGSSAVSAQVAEAMALAARSYVEMVPLKEAAARRIAELVGVPAACIVSSAAAGIVQSVAAAIVGSDLALIEQVPLADIARRDILIQKCHAVNFGAPVTQMIGLGGGSVVEIGSANRSYPYHLESAFGATTAAVVFVISHHTRPEVAISLEQAIELAHQRGVPVIVDAAAETDLRKYVELGADLVVYSGHKAIGGPTSGIVVGQPGLVAACAAQEMGVGRAMKVSKEAIAGLLCAVGEKVDPTTAVSSDQLLARLETVRQHVGDGLPLAMAIAWDATRPIPRLRIAVSASSPLRADQLVDLLEGGNPSIRTRNHDLARGVISVDPRELTLAGAKELGIRLRELLSRPEDQESAQLPPGQQRQVREDRPDDE